MQAKNLLDLCERMSGWSQHEIEILGCEVMTACDLGMHQYKIMRGKGRCDLCDKVYEEIDNGTE
jgi:hypothetical protein